jgi:hypothetical protein
MNFLNPAALFWLALALPIIVFYILKIRLRRMPVSKILFWQQIFEQKQPRSIWEHLRHLLSLLVQLALLGLLIFALSEPFFRWEARGARRLVLIVDNSASMNATDVKPTRLAEVKRRGRAIIDALRFTDEMAIIAAGTEPQVACGMTDHQRTLRDALNAIPSTDGPTRVEESIALARRLLADQKNRRVIVLTDGAFDGSEKLTKEKEIELVTVGGKADNVGITRFQVRRSLRDPIGYEILAEVHNASDKPAQCRLEIDLDNDVIDVVPLKLEPGKRWSQTFEKTSADGGRVVAKLDKPDALLADNQAMAILPRRELQRVTLVTDGNLFLSKVFEAIPLVRLTISKDPGAPGSKPGGIAVFHRKLPDRLPPGPVLVIEPLKSNELWDLGEKISSPIVTKQDKDSSLMAHVKLENVSMPEARQLTFKNKAQVLATAFTGEPVYSVVDRPEGKVYVITVDLNKSDLPLQTAFPIMMTNALAAIAGPKGELREAVATGGVTEVEVSAQAASASGPGLVLRSPNGSTRPLPRGMTTMLLGPFDRCGIWSVVRHGASKNPKVQPPPEVEVACNLSSRRESDLRAPEGLKPALTSRTGGFGGRPIWYYLIAVAWLLAGLEWFLYQRRWIS